MSNSSILKFIRYNRFKKRTVAIWCLMAFYRAQMLVVPSKKLQEKWGEKGKESPGEDTRFNYWYAYSVAQDIERVSKNTPWESKCLVKALTARFLLHRKGIVTTLYLGVGKDDKGKMTAHSWLRCGELYVTGGDGSGYATVAKFVM